MYCRSCHARLSARDRTCPSCGRKTEESQDLGSASVSDADTHDSYPLPPTMVLEKKAPRAPKSQGKVRHDSRSARAPDPDDDPESPALSLTELAPSEPERRAVQPRREQDRRPARGKESLGGFSAEDVRELVAEQPELIEPGLRVHVDAAGERVGAGFLTAVGPIDLLARDSAGGWVVIMVVEPREGKGRGKGLVGDLLQLMGWVRKHLGAKGQEVRGIVLLNSLPEDLGYAAAAVADSVEFKRYRFALTFEPLGVV